MNNYCKIYISGFSEKKILEDELLIQINFQKIDVYIDFNEDYNIDMQSIFPDGFLYYKFIVDLFFLESIKLSDCIETVNNILTYLWRNQKPAVAVCDYENELENNGGFNSDIVPFPINK